MEEIFQIRKRILFQSLKHWRHYLLPQEFVLYSDHEALRYLNSQSKLKGEHVKWVELLQEYTFILKHKAGVENKSADALSRRVSLIHSMNVEVTGFDRLRDDYPSCPDFGDLFASLSDNPLRSMDRFTLKDPSFKEIRFTSPVPP